MFYVTATNLHSDSYFALHMHSICWEHSGGFKKTKLNILYISSTEKCEMHIYDLT